MGKTDSVIYIGISLNGTRVWGKQYKVMIDSSEQRHYLIATERCSMLYPKVNDIYWIEILPESLEKRQSPLDK